MTDNDATADPSPTSSGDAADGSPGSTAGGDAGSTGQGSSDERHVEVERGDAVVPDADQAADSEDLKPEDPPAGAPAEGDPAKKTAVAAPIPAHGEMASQELLQEAARAAQEEDEDA